MGEASVSGLRALAPVPQGDSLRGQHGTWPRGWPFRKAAVFVRLLGPVGQHWAPFSLLTLVWPALESEDGGKHLVTCQAQTLIHIRQN